MADAPKHNEIAATAPHAQEASTTSGAVTDAKHPGLTVPAGLPTTLRCATVQFEHRNADKAYNLSRIEHFTALAAADNVKIVVFPEMCITGYWFVRNLTVPQVAELAEPRDGPSIRAVQALAEKYGMGVGAGWIELAEDGRLFNSYAVCLPDGTVHVHRKIHSFEHEGISSGENYTVFDTPWGVRVGVLICYDNNLIENVRATALLGAHVLLSPHQTGGTHSRSPYSMKPIPLELWDNRASDPDAIQAAILGPSGREWLARWLFSRAHDNGIFLIFSNGIGRDDDEIRTGNAMLLDPYGRVIKETFAAADDMVVADLEFCLLDRCTGQRWLRGRRPELYGILTQAKGNELKPREARFSEAPTY